MYDFGVDTIRPIVVLDFKVVFPDRLANWETKVEKKSITGIFKSASFGLYISPIESFVSDKFHDTAMVLLEPEHVFHISAMVDWRAAEFIDLIGSCESHQVFATRLATCKFTV